MATVSASVPPIGYHATPTTAGGESQCQRDGQSEPIDRLGKVNMQACRHDSFLMVT